jgi:hypothetical protein
MGRGSEGERKEPTKNLTNEFWAVCGAEMKIPLVFFDLEEGNPKEIPWSVLSGMKKSLGSY